MCNCSIRKIIDALDNGKRGIIDEHDSRLHPLLVKRIVALFNDARTNPKGAQLMFTAHDTYLFGKYSATPLIGDMESVFNPSKQS